MKVLYFSHPAFLEHHTGVWHPERPARLGAVERGAMSSGQAVVRVDAPQVERAVLEATHPAAYIDSLERFCMSGGGGIDADTFVSPGSFEAALRAAGAGVEAIARLEGGGGDLAFCAVRPPGHHALASQAMGFCLFNNAVVAARALTSAGARVAIVDWDVHHGNGTQHLVEADPSVLYVSLHQAPFYPGGGDVSEVGIGAGEGTVLNLPVPAGTGGDVYRTAFDTVVVPVLAQFQPDWLLVSAGFDAHEEDPLAELRLLASDYQYMAHRLAGTVAPGRTIVFLEGGYHLPALTTAVAGTLVGFSGVAASDEMRRSPSVSWGALGAARHEVERFWKL